jgi:hypothetical protein
MSLSSKKLIGLFDNGHIFEYMPIEAFKPYASQLFSLEPGTRTHHRHETEEKHIYSPW